MKFDVHELQAKLDYYFTGKLSKRELGEWANKAYYDILKGGYIEIEKFVTSQIQKYIIILLLLIYLISNLFPIR